MASDSIFESFPAYSQCFMRGEYAGLFISDLVQLCRLKWQPVDPPGPVWGPCLLGGEEFRQRQLDCFSAGRWTAEMFQ